VNQNENPFGEAMLRQAFIEYHRRELAALPPEAELAKLHTFSSGHEVRMKALLAKADRRVFWHKAVRVSRRVAAVVLIAVTLLFGLLLTHPEVQAAVQKVFVEWYDTFTRFAFPDTQVIAPDVEWQLAYVPEGFEQSFYAYSNGDTEIEYQNLEGEFIRLQVLPTIQASFSVDNENSNYTVKQVDDVEYQVFSASSDEYVSRILWDKDGYAFMLTSTLTTQEIMEIALSSESKK
jgi:hypothetical protein